MRSILSISLPAEKKKELEKRAKQSNKTVSGYIVQILELEKSLISEDEIIAKAQKAEKDYKTGKTKKLTGLSDLMSP